MAHLSNDANQMLLLRQRMETPADLSATQAIAVPSKYMVVIQLARYQRLELVQGL